ncbi:uncharacterized protein G2W53_001813 [Senna tora]|uniref:Secreted protein n=1 Tax=Senna tora TaxID=362788 RepID=A0A834XHY8_9FABA|nr:uncharacterized protein G2W53_001813 [Senna tora]
MAKFARACFLFLITNGVPVVGIVPPLNAFEISKYLERPSCSVVGQCLDIFRVFKKSTGFLALSRLCE